MLYNTGHGIDHITLLIPIIYCIPNSYLSLICRKWSCVSSCNARISMNIWGNWILRFWTNYTTTLPHVWLSTGRDQILYDVYCMIYSTYDNISVYNFILCLIFYRELPSLAKNYVMRMLFLDQPLPQAAVALWVKKDSQKWVRDVTWA